MSTRFVSTPAPVNPGHGPWPGTHRGGICPECRAEVRDPHSRHFRDPFHNCGECGPGAAITRRFPFVRENTSYAEFEPCPACRAENEAPDSRQAGSPSTSCPDCGPQYWIEPAPPLSSGGDLVYEVSGLLRRGKILALKDQRAFRLIARSDDDALVQRLRRRQEWRGTPVGLMVRDMEMARRVAVLDEESEEQLRAVSSPRVIVPFRSDAPVAVRLRELAEVELMLPPEPVYEILFGDLADDTDAPLIAIPAQIGVDAPVRENEEARRILRDVVDYLVLHDLELFPCTEDWVVRMVDSEPVVLRRSGADTDIPLPLPESAPQVLGLGCSSEATAAAALADCIRMGPFVGELDSERAVEQFGRTARRLLELFDGHPKFVAYDPVSQVRMNGVIKSIEAEPVPVDHHHAHVAAVMAEHGMLGPVVGLALDGPAPVVDHDLGRAVILEGTAADMRPVEEVPGFRIPAANLAGRDSWRTALGFIHDVLGSREAEDWGERFADSPVALQTALKMLASGADCTKVESFGRTMCAIAEIIQVECAPPVARSCGLGRVAGEVRDIDPGSLPPKQLRTDALLGGILSEVFRRCRERRSAADTAAWAMTSLVRGIGYRTARVAHDRGRSVVVAGGGGLAEPWVRHVLRRTLEEEGLDMFLSRNMPCGDAGIALGQVWSVVARES
jgi:hydrogenase maturation protein HypF